MRGGRLEDTPSKERLAAREAAREARGSNTREGNEMEAGVDAIAHCGVAQSICKHACKHACWLWRASAAYGATGVQLMACAGDWREGVGVCERVELSLPQGLTV